MAVSSRVIVNYGKKYIICLKSNVMFAPIYDLKDIDNIQKISPSRYTYKCINDDVKNTMKSEIDYKKYIESHEIYYSECSYETELFENTYDLSYDTDDETNLSIQQFCGIKR
jgi:hypothetical protein